MKKFIVIIGFLFMACNSNDAPAAVADKTYTVRIQKVCPDGVQTAHNISKDTYDRISTQTGSGQCEYINFKDLSNTSYGGYFRSISVVN